ncbi:flagellar protein export ATPase FliI [Derxia gummosa]|uniref:Flagellum-specific ATP synthase n=1 Tax=Derxia gummosa DSM 723 TaxID=1121388 RepID=A0A8B6X949_9BURK|nr:flagellar protein export ATPase FliI [Derxia gummosa]
MKTLARPPQSDAPGERTLAFLGDCADFSDAVPVPHVAGRLVRVSGLVMEAIGVKLPLGSMVKVSQGGGQAVEAEVVGFSGEKVFLMPYSEPAGLMPGARVEAAYDPLPPPRYGEHNHPWRRAEDRTRTLPVGWELLGRVVDANGRALDRLPEPDCRERRPLRARPMNPIERAPVEEVLDVGVRALNGLLTIGKGQRIGLFAGSGVGKSVLLGMMARYTEAEVIVVGLIGERGREVKEFIEHILGEEGRRKAVVVAAPADCPPLLRLQGAAYATTIAEYFRDQGKQVLLMMDSLTRYAMAQREIALAIGEPPATKGYPPSVFAKLPALVERAGNGEEGGGSITAFYTVLSEGDDQQDPIADNARAILDGHVVLSRQLAEQGHYPAIDIEQSISRVMNQVVSREHARIALDMKKAISNYQRNRDLLAVGAYVQGSDPAVDSAIANWPLIEAFLRQDLGECSRYADTTGHLGAIVSRFRR